MNTIEASFLLFVKSSLPTHRNVFLVCRFPLHLSWMHCHQTHLIVFLIWCISNVEYSDYVVCSIHFDGAFVVIFVNPRIWFQLKYQIQLFSCLPACAKHNFLESFSLLFHILPYISIILFRMEYVFVVGCICHLHALHSKLQTVYIYILLVWNVCVCVYLVLVQFVKHGSGRTRARNTERKGKKSPDEEKFGKRENSFIGYAP